MFFVFFAKVAIPALACSAFVSVVSGVSQDIAFVLWLAGSFQTEYFSLLVADWTEITVFAGQTAFYNNALRQIFLEIGKCVLIIGILAEIGRASCRERV